MRGYDRDEYERYEDYEDYEEDGYGDDDGEGEYEEEEEEQRKPSAEELEYLELRERLKERIRRKMLKQKGASADSRSQEIRKKSDSFGSFFGPSQPVIAQRVIQESKTLLENPHLAVKALNSRNEKKAASTGSGSGSKNGVHEQISKVRKELHTKVQKLKDTRDYSFLLSDDAELPAPAKQPVPRNVTAPKTEARSVQGPQKSRQLSGSSIRDSQGDREARKSVHMNGQMRPNSGAHRPNSVGKTAPSSIDSRRQLSSSNGIGPGRPTGPKGSAPKMPLANGHRKVSAPAPKTIAPATCKPLPPKMQSSVPRQHAEQKRPLQDPRRSVAAPKQPPMQKQPPIQRQPPPRNQPVASSRPQINKPMKPVSSRPPLHGRHDNRPKKRPSRPFPDDDDDNMEAFAMLRQMTRSDRWRNVDDDDDDDLSDMEANFDQIQKEENYSTLIARKEDEEQLKLIMEEERREEERRRAKKRKLMQQR